MPTSIFVCRYLPRRITEFIDSVGHCFLGDSTADWAETSATRAVAVETSAYAIMGYLCLGDKKGASPIVTWLNAQRGLGGGFVSTQVAQNETSVLLTSGV